MAINPPDSLWEWTKDVRFFPTVVAGFVFVLTLTFYKELGDPLRQHLIGTSVAYGLGTALIGMIHATLFARAMMTTHQPLSGIVVRTILTVHVLWLLAALYYLGRRGVLVIP